MTFQEYQTLKSTIDGHMRAYYDNDAPTISDHDYDILMQHLKACEKLHPEWVEPDSPSQKIGGTAQAKVGRKIQHNVPMLSIEDVFSKDDVETWVKQVHQRYPGCKFSVETKIDGLSMTIRYKQGQDKRLHLVLAETRGDGFEGEDVTPNALVLEDIPKVIDLPYEYLELRGEVYMPHKAFEKYNEEQARLGNKPAANPRNLAAGTLRQTDPDIVRKRGLGIFIFNVQDGAKELMTSHARALEILHDYEVPTVHAYRCQTVQEIMEAIDTIGNMRAGLPYDIDGAVVKIDDIPLRKEFPAGNKYSAGHIAYKYPPEDAIVVMDDILVDVGRTGKLTYTGVFHDEKTGRPAVLCGTNVSRVTLHNQNYINDMEIGVGGKYSLIKSGEIIPKLNGCVFPPKKIFKSPSNCPVCGSPLEVDEDCADIYCINPSCPAQLVRTISYFASAGCMDIQGLGEKTSEALIKRGFIEKIYDIYELECYKDALANSDVFGGDRSVSNLLNAIEDSKTREPWRLLAGFGIRNVGISTAKELMKHYESIWDLARADEAELEAIDGIGHVTAVYISDFFRIEQNQRMVHDLGEAGVNMRNYKTDIYRPLNGISIAITGTLPTLGRKEAGDLIEANGGTYARTLSEKCNYILVGENPGSKAQKAKELGIPEIDEEQLLRMINEAVVPFSLI